VDQVTVNRHGPLLILCGKQQGADFCLDRFRSLAAFALGMEDVAGAPSMRLALTERNDFVLQRDRG
jgi:hypothetical protein